MLVAFVRSINIVHWYGDIVTPCIGHALGTGGFIAAAVVSYAEQI